MDVQKPGKHRPHWLRKKLVAVTLAKKVSFHAKVAVNFVLILLLSLAVISIPSATHAGLHPTEADEVLPTFITDLREIGLEENPSLDNMEILIKHLEKSLQETRETLRTGPFGKLDKKWYKEKLRFLQFAHQDLQQALNLPLATEERERSYEQSLRILYMLAATEYMEIQAPPSGGNLMAELQFDRVVKVARRFLNKKRLLNVTIPDLQRPIGLEKAKEEAAFLHKVDAYGASQPVPDEEMAQMTPLEIAQLDISDRHPHWLSNRQWRERPDTWEQNERWLNQQITISLRKDHGEDFDGRFPHFAYDLHSSQKVVFFEEVKSSGSSAKINARDPFDIQWKMKWSDEIHPEVIANRLYILLGARYVDPVYALRAGTEGTTLILNDPAGRDQAEQGECYPVTLDDFLSCIKRSYKFDLRNFIESSGTITRENYQQVLKYYPETGPVKFRKEQLIGRSYVTFKEGLMELRPPKKVVLRGGPVSLNRFGARRDRVTRGLLLFNAWINNNDHKEDNSRGYLLSDFPLGQSEVAERFYYEGQHDMGKSMGGIIGSGNANHLYTGPQFMNRWPHTVQFNFLLFKMPGAWMTTTYPDLLWMGERIAKLTREQIQEVVAQTHWPDFMQEAMVYRILARRNRVAQVLQLEDKLPKGEGELIPPSYEVPLGTPEERSQAAKKYQIPLQELEELYALYPRKRNYTDRVLYNGRVSLCESTLLIRLLHRHRHPTGLDRRLPRYKLIRHLTLRKNCGGIPKVDDFIR